MSNGASVQVKPDQIDWTKDPFKSVNDAVAAEASRTAVAMKFLPPYGPLPSDHANGTVPADTIIVDNKAKTISVDSTATRPIIEIMVPFTLKQQQYDEENLNTAVTAATRAANLLAQAKDLICFQGNDKATIDFFNENPVVLQSDFPLPNNLVALLNPKPDNVIKVFPKE